LEFDGKRETYIIVGTAKWEGNEPEPFQGRLLLFKAQSGSSRPVSQNPSMPVITLVMEKDINGAPGAIKAIDGVLAVIVNTVVSIFFSIDCWNCC